MNKLIKSAIITGALVLGITPLTLAKFTDLVDIGNYTKAIETLVEKGVINGYPDNTFKPAGKITRAEFVKMIAVNENLSEQNSEKIKFTDVENHWAKEYINLASENSIIKGYEDSTFKPNKEITYAEVISVLLNTMKDEELDENLNWNDACIKRAGELGLLDGIATNDLLGINPARRDNVALMIWNKENIQKENNFSDIDSTEQDDLEQDNSEKEEIAKPEYKINTKKLHTGIVTKVVERKGKDYVTVSGANGDEIEFELYSKSIKPEYQSFIVYKLNANAKMKVQKQLLSEEIENTSYLVEDVDGELVCLENESKVLDLALDEYVLNNKKIELDECSYYLVEMLKDKDDEYEFKSLEKIKREDLNVEEEDRMCFDSDTEIILIIRGM